MIIIYIESNAAILVFIKKHLLKNLWGHIWHIDKGYTPQGPPDFKQHLCQFFPRYMLTPFKLVEFFSE